MVVYKFDDDDGSGSGSGSDSGKSNGDVGEAQISYIYKTHYPFTRNWLDAEFIAGLCYNSLHLGPNKTIITTII